MSKNRQLLERSHPYPSISQVKILIVNIYDLSGLVIPINFTILCCDTSGLDITYSNKILSMNQQIWIFQNKGTYSYCRIILVQSLCRQSLLISWSFQNYT